MVYYRILNICTSKRRRKPNKKRRFYILKNLDFQLLLKGKMWPHWVHTLTGPTDQRGWPSFCPSGGGVCKLPQVFTAPSTAAS